MIQKVYENIYLNSVRLPNTPLKSLNSYIITDANRALIIDSGFNTQISSEDFFSGIKELGIDIKNTDLFLTHLHADHSGLASLFQRESSGKVYSSINDASYITKMIQHSFSDLFVMSLKLFGMEPSEEFFSSHPAVSYCPDSAIDFTYVKPNDIIKIADFELNVISVPGHTPDHISLYDPNKKIYFSGDHILDSISPNIAFWGDEHPDMLGEYLSSLDKTSALDIDIIFPSHRNIIKDYKRRIAEIKAHHFERLSEVLGLLDENGSKATVIEIASAMHWDYRAESFDAFPNAQKWFACSEAMAHLEHLKSIGKISSSDIQGIRYYFYNP